MVDPFALALVRSERLGSHAAIAHPGWFPFRRPPAPPSGCQPAT